MVGTKVYCSWICDTDPFSSLLCWRLRQSRAVWPGRQEPPIAPKRTMSHSEHSGKDFNTPPSHSSPASRSLVFNYTLSYSCLRAWIPQVFSSCLNARQPTANWEALTLFNMSNLSVMNSHTDTQIHTFCVSVALVALSRAKLSQVSNWDVIFIGEDALCGSFNMASLVISIWAESALSLSLFLPPPIVIKAPQYCWLVANRWVSGNFKMLLVCGGDLTTINSD